MSVDRRAQWAVVGRGQVGPILAVGSDRHPLVGEDVVAQERLSAERGQMAIVDQASDRVLGLVEIDDLAPVGQTGRGLLHAALRAIIGP